MDLVRLFLCFGGFIHCIGHIRCYVSCQFDFGLCGWRTLGNSMYSWRTNSGETMDRTSGPMNDVTCRNINGQYAYLPGSFSKRGEKAVLESELVNLKKQTEFTFWLSMKGVGIGSMDIILKFTNGTKVTIWSRQGEQDTGWQREHVTIGPGSFKIWFQGSVNLPYGSDVAIDDVMLGCENTVFNTSHCLRTTTRPTVATLENTTPVPTSTKHKVKQSLTSTTLKTTQVRPTMPSDGGPISSCRIGNEATPALPGSCDFENGLCNLTVRANEEDHDVVWMVSDKRDPYYFTAPIRWDHTYSNGSTHGHYLNFQNKVWLKLERNPYGKSASVETPVLTSTSVCLSFWYIMPTKEANLLVYIEDVDNTVRDLWQSNNVTPHWSNEVLSITHSKPFKIVFQSRNKNYNAKVALDDILITRVADLSSAPTTTYVQSKLPHFATESPGVNTSEKVPMTITDAYSSYQTTREPNSTLTKTTLPVSVRVPTASKPTPQQSTVLSTTGTFDSRRPSKVQETTEVHTSTYHIYIGHNKSEITSTVSAKNGEYNTTERSIFSTSEYILYETPKASTASTSVTQKTFATKTIGRIKSTTEMNKITKKPAQTTKKPKSSSNKTDEQTGHRYRNSSTVIGYSVGGLVFLTVTAVAIYYVRQYVQDKRQSKRHKSSSNMHHHKNGQDNNGLLDFSQTLAFGKTVLPTVIEQNGVLNHEYSIANGKVKGRCVEGDVTVEIGHNALAQKHSVSTNENEITKF